MTEFMEELMFAMSRAFPELLVQFEVREVTLLTPRLFCSPYVGLLHRARFPLPGLLPSSLPRF
jgi:hypothetical protein